MTRLLVLNPGSTSTKAAVYSDGHCEAKTTIVHYADELEQYSHIMQQYSFRTEAVRGWLFNQGLTRLPFDGIMARGGLLSPIPSGTYLVNDAVLDDLRHCRYGVHASNLAALMADEFSKAWEIPAFIADPVVVDELQDAARVSGHPEIERRSIFHALNQKAAARKAAERLQRTYSGAHLIVAHLGGGISVGAHYQGRVIDVNNALDGEGPMSPERAGTLPVTGLIRHVFRTGIQKEQLYRRLVGQGGLVAHLGSNDGREIEERIVAGDARARQIYDVMAYQIGKEIGRCSMVLRGCVHGIVLTGGLAHSHYLVEKIKHFIDWIAPVIVLAGENELQALAEAGFRVFEANEQARVYPSGRFV